MRLGDVASAEKPSSPRAYSSWPISSSLRIASVVPARTDQRRRQQLAARDRDLDRLVRLAARRRRAARPPARAAPIRASRSTSLTPFSSSQLNAARGGLARRWLGTLPSISWPFTSRSTARAAVVTTLARAQTQHTSTRYVQRLKRSCERDTIDRSYAKRGSWLVNVAGRPERRYSAGVTNPRSIRIAYSPDADDAFMFWAIAQGRIDTRGFTFERERADTEALNRAAESTARRM